MDSTIYGIILFAAVVINFEAIYKFIKHRSSDRENFLFYILNSIVIANSLMSMFLLQFAEKEGLINGLVIIPVTLMILSYYNFKKIKKISIDNYQSNWKIAKINTYFLSNNTKKRIIIIYTISLFCIIFFLIILALLPWASLGTGRVL